MTDHAPPAETGRALTPLQQVSALIESEDVKRKIADSLAGLNVDPARFRRAALATLSTNDYLLRSCSVPSIYGAIMNAATLGLELHPALGHAAIVPRGGKATLQVMYKGYLALAYNTGRLISIDVGEICEHDAVEYERGTEPRLVVRPPIGKPRGEAIAWYCAAKWKDHGSTIELMTRAEIEAIRDQYSEAWRRQGKASPWGTAFGEMARKTVIMRARKSWPVSLAPGGALPEDPDLQMPDAAPAHADAIDVESYPVTDADAPQAVPVGRAARLTQLLDSAD